MATVPLPSPTPKLVGAAVAALLVAGAAAVAIGSDGGGVADRKAGTELATGDAGRPDEGPGGEPASESPSPTPAAPGAGAPPASAEPGEPPAAGTTAAQSPPPGASAGSTSDPFAPAPPKAGTYRYRTTTTEDGGSTEEEDEVTVEDAGTSGDRTRQRIRMENSFGPATNEVSWGSDTMLVESTRFEAFGDGECDWEPDMSWFRFPLSAGATWDYTSRCTMTIEGSTVDIVMTSAISVGGRTTTEIGGHTVEVVEIHRDTTVVVDAPGIAGRIHTVDDELMAPARGLVVASDGRWDVSFGAEQRSGSSSRRLLALDPA